MSFVNIVNLPVGMLSHVPDVMKNMFKQSVYHASPQRHYNTTLYIISFQIEHNRLELLQHPLVENFLFQKFWVMTFPLFLLNMLFYCTLLVALNSFALVVPRPGPDSETCMLL